MPKTLLNSLAIARQMIAQVLEPGGIAIDATAGKGRDTLFLAGRVGPQGKVWAFDLQPDAIKATLELVQSHGCARQVNLIQAGHETIQEHVTAPVNAIMFNLGYLPGGDKELVTKPATTLCAVQQALNLLAPAGIVTVVVYTGHQGGPEEAAGLENLVAELSPQQFNVIKVIYPNQIQTAPYVIAVQKR